MAVTIEKLIESYPTLYHMAEAGTWARIRENGLLSTTALLDLFEKDGIERFAIESAHRPASVSIDHEKYGTATIRDQKPMREKALLNCLDEMTPQEWYRFLNGKVFFWPTRERLLRLLNGKEYRDRTQLVIEVSTEQLLNRYHDRVSLSPINSGSTLYVPQRRGRSTFQGIDTYPFEERRKSRGIKNAVAEITVDYSVPEIGEIYTAVNTYHKGRIVN